MKKIILDGNQMIHKENVHPYLKEKLNLTGYYGNNLDALWDALHTSSEPIEIELIHSDQLLHCLSNYGESLVKVFKDAAKENPNIKFNIKKI